eukprot:COSAG02_NODE_16674_length_1064_cov_8.958727_2_plen_34_part_01
MQLQRNALNAAAVASRSATLLPDVLMSIGILSTG